uniref:Cation efflux protein transmembrane domain-containing protein n=1 Tax=Anopheles melas TaxID=34690 RepID=A0A182UB11_9DIPT
MQQGSNAAPGGIYSNSLAIATDAAHLMADLASFMISLFALWIAARPSTKRLSFGWYRAEVIGALLSVLMIWVVTAILFYLAVLRTINKDFELNGEVMLVTSGLGILVNIIMGATLHHHGHSHGGGGGHHEEQNINVRAAFVHVLSDFVQSLGVFIAALVIYFKPEWNIIDPICTFLFSVLVLGTTLAIMRDAIVVSEEEGGGVYGQLKRVRTQAALFTNRLPLYQSLGVSIKCYDITSNCSLTG